MERIVIRNASEMISHFFLSQFDFVFPLKTSENEVRIMYIFWGLILLDSNSRLWYTIIGIVFQSPISGNTKGN